MSDLYIATTRLNLDSFSVSDLNFLSERVLHKIEVIDNNVFENKNERRKYLMTWEAIHNQVWDEINSRLDILFNSL